MDVQAGAAGDTTKRPRGRPRKTAGERDEGNRRAQLLRVAARLFRRRGFDATSTRDIAAAAGMRSGSPFYHFESKGALLYAVMEEGMRSAIARQRQALEAAGAVREPAALLRVLVRNHFQVLLGPGSDFVPVMLYEYRSITARERRVLAGLQKEYEAPWLPALQGLHRAGRLRGDPKLARLLIFGALNWSAQWFDRRQDAGLEQLTQAAIELFIGGR
ncbi:MAG TPA: TetR/AcrR family transcriptional regulator [Ramlibacter sp.]|nr:TetR/AcrR family transcriptional regulator [Ramlibacter sp.]